MRDGENNLLNGSHRYTLTFPAGQLPPLHPLGFWSLTMYNESFLLVDNPLNRYIIRPDQPGLTYAPDGSLTLYLQAEKPAGVPRRQLAACPVRRLFGGAAHLPAPKGDPGRDLVPA